MESLPSIFANDEDDDGDYEEISEHTWTCGDVSIIYHLAFLARGHGDVVWNSSEYIAEELLNKRQDLFGEANVPWPPKKALEFGAGAALPSMVLLKEGAEQVIITDKKSNEMTFEALRFSAAKNAEKWGINKEELERRVLVKPHTWGENIEDLMDDNRSSFDLLVASDCIYNPVYHKALLKSASYLINKERGIFIVGYSFHMNVPPEQVLDFFLLAQSEYGFVIITELQQAFDGQKGIASKDPNRGVVYLKVLAHRDSHYCRRSL